MNNKGEKDEHGGAHQERKKGHSCDFCIIKTQSSQIHLDKLENTSVKKLDPFHLNYALFIYMYCK